MSSPPIQPSGSKVGEMDLFDLVNHFLLQDPDMNPMRDEIFDLEDGDLYHDDYTWYNVDESPDVRPRCGLCQFKFETFDLIVVCMRPFRSFPNNILIKYSQPMEL